MKADPGALPRARVREQKHSRPGTTRSTTGPYENPSVLSSSHDCAVVANHRCDTPRPLPSPVVVLTTSEKSSLLLRPHSPTTAFQSPARRGITISITIAIPAGTEGPAPAALVVPGLACIDGHHGHVASPLGQRAEESVAHANANSLVVCIPKKGMISADRSKKRLAYPPTVLVRSSAPSP